MKIEYRVHEVADVMAHWIRGYEKKVVNYDWFYDSHQGKIVFRLYVNDDTDNDAN